MCHRVAELIENADSSGSERRRAAARAAASDLVLRLWRSRTDWPDGWPPKGARAIISALERVPSRESRVPSGSRWLDSLGQLQALQDREENIWIDFALLDFDFKVERTALELGAQITDEERDVLKKLLAKRERAEQNVSRLTDGHAVPRSAARRAKIAKEELAKVSSEREKLIRDVLRPGKRRAN
jgi:cell division protein FtsB